MRQAGAVPPTVLRPLNPEHGAVVFLDEHIDQPVGPLADVADALVVVLQQGFAANLPELLVEDHALDAAGADRVAGIQFLDVSKSRAFVAAAAKCQRVSVALEAARNERGGGQQGGASGQGNRSPALKSGHGDDILSPRCVGLAPPFYRANEVDQSSHIKPSTRSNSRILAVTRVNPRRAACPARSES